MRSLVSAARHQPDHWDLLVPIDHNPAEEQWFERLREQFPFVREWRGRSWLEEQFAAHTDLVRYALFESGDYILERIGEARAERDVLLGGLPDYLERASALHARVQEISPHYAVHTTLGADGQTVVHLTPKGPARDGQASVRFTGRVRFLAGDEQETERRRRFEETMRFGGEVELDADNLAETHLAGPAGLGLDRLPLGGVRITSPRQEVTPPLQGQVIIQQPSGLPAASLSVTFTHRVRGRDGATLEGSDMTGLTRVRARVNQRDRSARLTISFQPSESVAPSAMLPLLRLIAESRPGLFMALVFAGGIGKMRTPLTDSLTPDGWEEGDAQYWADAIADLDRLQNRTNHFFPVPEDFSRQDVHEVKKIHTLLDGGENIIKGSSLSVTIKDTEALEQLAGAADRPMFRLTAGSTSLVFVLGEHEIHLGPCTETYTVDEILNLDETRRDLAVHGHAALVMQLAENFPAVRYLGPERAP